ncbi:hypothetical protein ILYODFUR_005412 [Ilyodon furcidens]|uniref:Uncharacterized protein n=1 Tax=Ilyodon furcidens TaxID=33524 RepID=A0ABV0U5W0_9TELE
MVLSCLCHGTDASTYYAFTLFSDNSLNHISYALEEEPNVHFSPKGNLNVESSDHIAHVRCFSILLSRVCSQRPWQYFCSEGDMQLSPCVIQFQVTRMQQWIVLSGSGFSKVLPSLCG